MRWLGNGQAGRGSTTGGRSDRRLVVTGTQAGSRRQADGRAGEDSVTGKDRQGQAGGQTSERTATGRQADMRYTEIENAGKLSQD